MKNSSEVLDKLDELLAYSCSTDPDHASEYVALMSPMKGAVSAYFSADRSGFKDPFKEMRYGLYSDIRARGTVIETEFDLGYSTDYPSYYTDLRKMFYQFPCMTVSGASFHSAWVLETPEVEEGSTETPEPIITRNTLIDSWVASLSTAIDDELKTVNSFVNWLEGASDQSESIFFWENVGEIKKEPTTEEIAKIIFIDRGFKEAVKLLNLPVYLPSYV